jgi:hypothetical protein
MHSTMMHGQRSSSDHLVCVIACLAEGLSIRGSVRVFASHSTLVLQWLVEAAEPLTASKSVNPFLA